MISTFIEFPYMVPSKVWLGVRNPWVMNSGEKWHDCMAGESDRSQGWEEKKVITTEPKCQACISRLLRWESSSHLIPLGWEKIWDFYDFPSFPSVRVGDIHGVLSSHLITSVTIFLNWIPALLCWLCGKSGIRSSPWPVKKRCKAINTPIEI